MEVSDKSIENEDRKMELDTSINTQIDEKKLME
jgi:hypothetical protein